MTSTKKDIHPMSIETPSKEEGERFITEPLQSEHGGGSITKPPLSKRLWEYNLYFLYALLASMCFGIHSYMLEYGMQVWELQSIILPEAFTNIAFTFLFHGGNSILVKMKSGNFWNREKSVWIDQDSGKFSYRTLVIVLARGYFCVQMTVNVTFVIYFARLANASPAVMLSITTFASFTNALAFYWLYKEKLHWQHIVGMVSIIVCVFIVAISRSMSEDGGFNVTSFKQAMIPIAIAIFECISMTIGSILLRMAVKRGYHPLEFTIDITGVGGVFYLIGYIYVQATYHCYTWGLFWYMQLAAFDLIIAFVLLNMSLKHGKGGLAMAIVQTQSFFQLLLEVIVQGQIPNLYEIIALIFGIIGSTVIAFAKGNDASAGH